jgi:spermidine synthase
MTKRLFPSLSEFVQSLTDSHGKPCVQDDGDVRCLQFGGGVVQSSMRISEPYELDLSYTRTMMGFVLFDAEPRDILIVGLGGGSLSKYCYKIFPQSRITTLEINPGVIALRDRFQVPRDDERFQVVHVDACEYMARCDAQADVILLDGYDANGLPACLCTESFYADCWRALSTKGVLVANLWGSEGDRGRYLKRLCGVFDGRAWRSKPRDCSNLIVFAVRNERYFPRWSRLMSNARRLEERYRLELPRIVEDMRHNTVLSA